MDPSSPRAVFLSYASQDEEAARRLADALRAVGVEVWFDQNELVGGDAWDGKIRRQIKSCTLFVPVISANTQARAEGYFRREWKLAVERTHDMADHVAFLVPVLIDDTDDREAHVPEKFREVQWTHVTDAGSSAAFVALVRRLLERAPSTQPPTPTVAARRSTPPPDTPSAPPRSAPPPLRSHGTTWAWGALVTIVIAVAAYVAFRPGPQGPASPPLAAGSPAAAAADKSIAVLPFENRSSEKDSAFFADGMQDEVITALTKIHDLTVISRRSVMAYAKTDSRNLKQIAAALGVASVLEGSVQHAGNKVRVIVQLIDARRDAHLWAEDYTEDVSDVFSIQSKIAAAITTALKATLSLEEKTLIGRRPTKSNAAYEYYLQAKLAHSQLAYNSPLPEWERAAQLLAQAVAADPDYAQAYALLAQVHAGAYWAGNLDPTPARRTLALDALAAAERLAPGAPETRLAEGRIAYACDLDFAVAKLQFAAALSDLPNDSDLLANLGAAERRLGRLADAAGHFQQAIDRDPDALGTVEVLLDTLTQLGRFKEAIELGERYPGPTAAHVVIAYDVASARYELDGDRSKLAAWIHATLAAMGHPTYGWFAYQAAYVTGDYAAAAKALSDPKLKTAPGLGGTVEEPVALHRAFMARLLGQTQLAATEAAAATAYLQAGKWTRRQLPLVKLALVRAAAYGGRNGEARRLADELMSELHGDDFIDEGNVLGGLGHVYALLGARDQAFDCLKKLVARSARLRFAHDDPFWSLLKDDPRFEEILKTAKPL
jgi:TolB-like protein